MMRLKALAAATALVALGSTARAEDQAVVHHANPAGIVLRDTVTGGVLGAAVAGGIIGYNMGIQNHSDYNWQRTLAWGAGIGLAAGLVWGIVDATSASSSYAAANRLALAHDGQSRSLDVPNRQAPGEALFPVALGRF